MRVIVLGASAGGGVPQWNCACPICAAARAGVVTPRTQASAAISADGERWYLLHATPDVRAQLEACPTLHPRPVRDTRLAGILLGNGDLDACLGLLSLREGQPVVVYATAAVERGFLDGNQLHRALARWPGLRLGIEQPLDEHLAVTAFAVPGKMPLHVAATQSPSPEDTVALRIRDRRDGHIVVWAPSVAAPTAALDALLREAHLVLFDGTCWSSEVKGHWPLGGAAGSLATLTRLPGEKVLVHINHSNPILLPTSPERAAVRAAGVLVGEDGMEFTP